MDPALTCPPRVSVILVTWNNAAFLDRCLEGISAQDAGAFELIHIDNASSDDGAARIRSAFPRCIQILNEDNRGFAGAVNQGIAAARGEFVLLCNPDAYLAAGYVDAIERAFAQAGDRFGMATGKLLRATGSRIEPTGEVDSKGIRMTRTGRHLDIGQGEPDRQDHRGLVPLPGLAGLCEVFGVSGAAAMYRMSFIRDVSIDGQFLDEDFFTYREDADVAWRGRVLGWRGLYVPGAVAHHVRTVTPHGRRGLSEVTNRNSFKNRFLLRLKNEGIGLALRNAPFEVSRDLLAIGAVLTVERSSLPAVGWLWKNRRRIMARRSEIQRRRRTPDRELARWFR